jgi:hypothetical protein
MLIREFDADEKLRIKQFWHQFNIKMMIVMCIFNICSDSQECKPCV